MELQVREVPADLRGIATHMIKAHDDGTFLLTFHGPFPSKKNRLRPRKGPGRGKMYDPEVKALILSMEMEARSQWGSHPYLDSPGVEIWMYVANFSKDRDGIWTTILDVLKKGRVIFDDSIRFYNGNEHKYPAQLSTARDERVLIRLTPKKENEKQ